MNEHYHHTEDLDTMGASDLTFHINYSHPELELPQNSTPTIESLRSAHKKEHVRHPHDYTDCSSYSHKHWHSHVEGDLYQEATVHDHLRRAHSIVYEASTPDADDYHKNLHTEGFIKKEDLITEEEPQIPLEHTIMGSVKWNDDQRRIKREEPQKQTIKELFTEDMMSEARKPGHGKISLPYNEGLLNPRDQIDFQEAEDIKEIPLALQRLEDEIKETHEVVTRLLDRIQPITRPIPVNPEPEDTISEDPGRVTDLGARLEDMRKQVFHIGYLTTEVLNNLGL